MIKLGLHWQCLSSDVANGAPGNGRRRAVIELVGFQEDVHVGCQIYRLTGLERQTLVVI